MYEFGKKFTTFVSIWNHHLKPLVKTHFFFIISINFKHIYKHYNKHLIALTQWDPITIKVKLLTPKVLCFFQAQICLKLPPLTKGGICQDLKMLQSIKP
jgi:hypothetical protein